MIMMRVEMGLLDFVKSVDPFKVKVGEQTLAENEVPLITKTKDRVISPSLQAISLVDHTIHDELNVNSGKRKKMVAFVSGSPPRLIRQGEQAAACFGSAIAATEDATSSFVTPTLERALEDAPHENVRTRPPSSLFVVLSFGFVDTNILATSQVVPPVSSSQAGASTIDSATTLNVYVPNWSVTPPGYWAESSMFQLVQFAGESKIQEEFLSHQDAAERCFAELDARNADVRRDMDNDLYPPLCLLLPPALPPPPPDAPSPFLPIDGWRWVVGHSFRLAVHKCARSLECRSALGKVISMAINKGIQVGLEAGVGHGRAGRSLTQIEAYDPEVKGKYVATPCPLLRVVFRRTVRSIIRRISANPSLQIDRINVCPQALLRWTSVPFTSDRLLIGIADYQVSTLVLTDDGGTTNPPLVVQSHDDLFDTSILDKSGDV
ncbi:hypothetical protein Tco_1225279 [Tanacetum coccineum]